MYMYMYIYIYIYTHICAQGQQHPGLRLGRGAADDEAPRRVCEAQ